MPSSASPVIAVRTVAWPDSSLYRALIDEGTLARLLPAIDGLKLTHAVPAERVDGSAGRGRTRTRVSWRLEAAGSDRTRVQVRVTLGRSIRRRRLEADLERALADIDRLAAIRDQLG